MINSMTTIHNTLNKQHINVLYHLWVPKKLKRAESGRNTRTGLANDPEKSQIYYGREQ